MLKITRYVSLILFNSMLHVYITVLNIMVLLKILILMNIMYILAHLKINKLLKITKQVCLILFHSLWMYITVLNIMVLLKMSTNKLTCLILLLCSMMCWAVDGAGVFARLGSIFWGGPVGESSTVVYWQSCLIWSPPSDM